jgi:ATP-dependent Clp protease protease subunit
MLITHKTSVRSRSNKRESITDKSPTEATIYLYGDIGGWFGIDHQEWIKEFNAITADTIHLRIDSSGGDIFAARAMKTCIEQHKANVIAHVDGLSASAASFMMMGANEIEMVDGGFIMIHKAMSMIDILGYFNEDDLQELCDDMQKEMALHSKINDSIANDYAKKTGMKKEEMLPMMEAETWMTAQEALDCGMIDRIYDGQPVEGSYDLSIYAKVPDSLSHRNQSASKLKRSAEKALRDAGFSDKQAKTIIAKGYQDEKRDADPPISNPLVTPIVEPVAPVEPKRDVAAPVVVEQAKRDRVSELLCRAEVAAPSK